ncbi:DUF4935 domain-containing protein [Chromobacterium alkanivorans]|uniref:PIN domain-containing protein n=1 Tax=Chromobacterium alkanivorans TaxID=1071719 RepID=UPI001967215B|nr:PIN domain-containing protein [Chromobacterium alkanivorans]MBN3005598.1 DUF4935 domain-containing protein [Chromobacterium alkanivorans]
MPIMSPEQLKEAILTGDVIAFTIDTSIYKAQNFGFEAGLLATLGQFKDSDIRFLMVDMVRYEVTEHLKEEAKLVKSQFQNAMKPLLNAWGTSNDLRNQIKSLVFGEDTEMARTESRVSTFEEGTGSEFVCVADHVESKDIVELYFNKTPPFSERKKEEFPDAFTLKALDGWSESNGGKVIAIAKDGDWKHYCENSPNLIYLDDLSQALSILNVNANDAVALVKRLISEGAFGDFTEYLCGEMNSETYKITAHVDASSYLHFEEELDEITFENIKQDVDAILERFEAVELSGGQLVVAANVTCGVRANFSVSFDAWDGIDREYLSVGSDEYESTLETDFELLIKFSLDDGDVDIAGVELISRYLTFYLGEISPFNSDDEDYYEFG